MIKPDALRAALVEALPDLALNPARLKIFVDKGKVHARQTAALGFEYRYTLTLMLLDFTGDPDAAMLPILIWVAANQPDLLEREAGSLAFEVDLLSDSAVDLSIELELRESIRVRNAIGGGHVCEPMPQPSLPDLDIPVAGS